MPTGTFTLQLTMPWNPWTLTQAQDIVTYADYVTSVIVQNQNELVITYSGTSSVTNIQIMANIEQSIRENGITFISI